jgi:hypothetical protein
VSNTSKVCERFAEDFNAAIAAQEAAEKNGRPWPRGIINIRGGGIDAHRYFIGHSTDFHSEQVHSQ